MKKYLKNVLSFILIFIVTFIMFGCGETTFDDIPYSALPENITMEQLAQQFTTAKTSTADQDVAYFTEYTLTTREHVFKRNYTTIITKYNHQTIMKVVCECFTDDEKTATIEQICYNGTGKIYTHTIDEISSNETKTLGEYDTNIFSGANLISKLLPTVDSQTAENMWIKSFDDVSYVKIKENITAVNEKSNISSSEEEFLQTINSGIILSYYQTTSQKIYNPFGNDALNCKLDNQYIMRYYTEFGINKRGYVSMFRTEYEIEDNTPNICGIVKATSTLTAFGQDVESVTLPEDIDSYIA